MLKKDSATARGLDVATPRKGIVGVRRAASHFATGHTESSSKEKTMSSDEECRPYEAAGVEEGPEMSYRYYCKRCGLTVKGTESKIIRHKKWCRKSEKRAALKKREQMRRK